MQLIGFYWSGHQDLNLGPPAPKAGALPGCATPRNAVKAGFEPAVPFARYVGLANRWFQPLTHFTVFWLIIPARGRFFDLLSAKAMQI